MLSACGLARQLPLLHSPLLHSRGPVGLHRHFEPQCAGRYWFEGHGIIFVLLDAVGRRIFYRLPLFAIQIEDAPRRGDAHFAVARVVEPIKVGRRDRRGLVEGVFDPFGRSFFRPPVEGRGLVAVVDRERAAAGRRGRNVRSEERRRLGCGFRFRVSRRSSGRVRDWPRRNRGWR